MPVALPREDSGSISSKVFSSFSKWFGKVGNEICIVDPFMSAGIVQGDGEEVRMYLLSILFLVVSPKKRASLRLVSDPEDGRDVFGAEIRRNHYVKIRTKGGNPTIGCKFRGDISEYRFSAGNGEFIGCLQVQGRM
jgi:hypothetical protein